MSLVPARVPSSPGIYLLHMVPPAGEGLGGCLHAQGSSLLAPGLPVGVDVSAPVPFSCHSRAGGARRVSSQMHSGPTSFFYLLVFVFFQVSLCSLGWT